MGTVLFSFLRLSLVLLSPHILADTWGGGIGIPPSTEGGTLVTAMPVAPGQVGMWASICSALACPANVYGAPAYLANKIYLFVLSIVAGVAVCALIWGGILMLSSQGSEEKLTQARQIVLYALLGLTLAGLTVAVINAFKFFITDVTT